MIRRTREKVKITFEVILSLFLLTQLSFFAPAEDVWSKVDRIVAVGDVHGGISSKYANVGRTEINDRIRQELDDFHQSAWWHGDGY